MGRINDKKNSISKQLMKSYFLLFPFFLLLLCIVALFGSIISHSLLAPNLPAHEFNLEEIMQDDITRIDISDLIKSGGGGAVLLFMVMVALQN